MSSVEDREHVESGLQWLYEVENILVETGQERTLNEIRAVRKTVENSLTEESHADAD